MIKIKQLMNRFYPEYFSKNYQVCESDYAYRSETKGLLR